MLKYSVARRRSGVTRVSVTSTPRMRGSSTSRAMSSETRERIWSATRRARISDTAGSQLPESHQEVGLDPEHLARQLALDQLGRGAQRVLDRRARGRDHGQRERGALPQVLVVDLGHGQVVEAAVKRALEA